MQAFNGPQACDSTYASQSERPFIFSPESRQILKKIGEHVSNTSRGAVRFVVGEHSLQTLVKGHGQWIRAEIFMLLDSSLEFKQSVACFTDAATEELERSAQTMLEIIVEDKECMGGWELLNLVVSVAANALSVDISHLESTLQFLQQLSGISTDTKPGPTPRIRYLLCMSDSSSHSPSATLDVMLKIPKSDALASKTSHLGMDLSFPILLEFTDSTLRIHVKLEDAQKKFVFEAIQDRVRWFFVQNAKPSHVAGAESRHPPIDLVQQTVGIFLDHVSNLHRKCLVCGADTRKASPADSPALHVCSQSYCMFMHKFKLEAAGVLIGSQLPTPPRAPSTSSSARSWSGCRVMRGPVVQLENLVQLRVLFAMEAVRAVAMRPETAKYIFSHRPDFACEDWSWTEVERAMKELSDALKEPKDEGSKGGSEGANESGEKLVDFEDEEAAEEAEEEEAEEEEHGGGGDDDDFLKFLASDEILQLPREERAGDEEAAAASCEQDAAAAGNEGANVLEESEVGKITMLEGPEQGGSVPAAVDERLRAKSVSQECYKMARWLFSVPPFPTLTLLEGSGRFKCFDDPSVMQVMVSPTSMLEEGIFRDKCAQRGSQFLFHGSKLENWNQIVTTGLKVMSGTPHEQNGARLGTGIYLSDDPCQSWRYSGSDNGTFVLAICQVLGKHVAAEDRFSGIFVVKDESLVRVRFLIVVKPGSGDKRLRSEPIMLSTMYPRFGERGSADVDSHARQLLGISGCPPTSAARQDDAEAERSAMEAQSTARQHQPALHRHTAVAAAAVQSQRIHKTLSSEGVHYTFGTVGHPGAFAPTPVSGTVSQSSADQALVESSSNSASCTHSLQDSDPGSLSSRLAQLFRERVKLRGRRAAATAVKVSDGVQARVTGTPRWEPQQPQLRLCSRSSPWPAPEERAAKSTWGGGAEAEERAEGRGDGDGEADSRVRRQRCASAALKRLSPAQPAAPACNGEGLAGQDVDMESASREPSKCRRLN